MISFTKESTDGGVSFVEPIENLSANDGSSELPAIATEGNSVYTIDVTISLDMPFSEVMELQQEYWALKELYDLAFVFLEIKNDLSSFMKLFKLLKQNRMLNEKHNYCSVL